MSALALASPSGASERGGQDRHDGQDRGGGQDRHDGQDRRGGQDRHGQKIEMQDDCNPASFNAAFGNVCIGDGKTTVEQFFAQLGATAQAKEWKFDPSMLTIRAGRPVILENEGGETHTFTMVGAFGGGFVAGLNDISRNHTPAGECATTLPGGILVPQPPSAVNVFVDADKEAAFATAGLAPGSYKFECCIHPWMRVVLTVK